MSSTASVVPNVSYHLPKPVTQNFQHFDCGSDGSVLGFNHQSSPNNDYGPTTNFLKSESSISASKLVSYNLDNALRLSFKSSTVPLNGHISNYTEKLSQRPLSFHESSAPPLDSVIKQKIQSLPRSLILTDSEECKAVKKSSTETKLLCSDDELDHLCQTGAHCIPKRALGFGNSGNTCYLNSVLQCILATGPLLAYINHKHSNPGSCIINSGRSSIPSLNKSRFCVLCGLSRLINEHHSQNGRTIPSYFVTNVRAICPSLRPYQQEDAHEFLLGLLSRMEDSSLAGLGKVSRKLSETNVIRRIFGGVIRSEVTCHSCLKVSARDEQCFNLSMDITCARSLQQCLCNYVRSEELSGQNAYKCENCHQLRAAMRKCTIYRAPPILIIQLNRFSRHQKLDIRVDFPSSFNLRPFMTQSKGLPILYKLYAIVNHEGYSCRSGHYVSFTLRHGQWLSLNDSFVSTTNTDHVLRQSPYLLFYEAVSYASPIVPSTSISTGLNNSMSLPSKNKSIQDIIESGKNHHSNIVSTVSSVSSSTSSSTTTSIPLSAATVRELLYGKETSSNLWTERPTPINEPVLSLSSTSSSSITTLSHCNKNLTNEQSSVNLSNSSDNLTTISTTKVQTTSSQSPSVNTVGLKNKQRELTNPLVDYSYEESDSDKNVSPPPPKRSRTSHSGSDSGTVWVPGNHNETSEKHHKDKSSSDVHKRHKKKHKSRHSSKHSSSHHNSWNGSDDNRHHHNHRNRELDRSSSLPRPSSDHHHHDKHRRRHHHKKYRQDSRDSKDHRFHSHHKHYKQSHSHENGYR
ncbi:ubiquitin-specific peptidase 42 (C19 family) [Schistosoma mansoni]|uniref:ubiquitin-specific peptidase 42 (C19 family) n=1 Tax=Schistosoma mansoni TaxID=6183 RepID=UPI0001A63C21|nr:ubiquitin-specific peptidase 42 (C19 family) [Schistosoma mansoni]|eukprot:XP_018653333.1 ubiquitin-specific peptidase 42 (C19 family) [Schistosoma mansoni]